MVQARTRAWLSTVTLVVGALLIGDAIHGVVTVGAYGFTSPAAVVRVVAGIALVAVGARLRTPADQYVSSVSEEPEEGGPPESEFEPSLSPVGESMEGAEREDSTREEPEETSED
ncbi:MAG: hypothetical protein ABEH90_09375 [Halolamina sp.]